MEAIRLLLEKSELRGTCYFELLPGKFRGEHWNDDSVFLTEFAFTLIEPIVLRHQPSFDHDAFEDVRRSTWERILVDLELLVQRAKVAGRIADLRPDIGFQSPTAEQLFADDFNRNVQLTISMIQDLLVWLRQQLKCQESIAILGL